LGKNFLRPQKYALPYTYATCYGLADSSVKNVSVTFWFCLQRYCKTFCFVCFYQAALCRQSLFVLWSPCLLV